MKRIILVLALISCITFTHAQGVRMGLSASPQFSWLKSDAANIESNGTVAGFKFGLSTDFFFAERYSFSTGIFINNTGGKLSYKDSISFQSNQELYTLENGADIRYRIQYIDVPLAFRMESNKIGYFVYYAQFGLTNQFRVGSSADIASDSINVSGIGCKDEVGLYNLGYTIGGGANYYFSKNTAVTLGVIYTNGFIDVTNNSSSDNAVLRTITISAGVLF